MSTFVIMARNPSTGRLVIVMSDAEGICEFATKDDAKIVADKIAALATHGYQVVEVPA